MTKSRCPKPPLNLALIIAIVFAFSSLEATSQGDAKDAADTVQVRASRVDEDVLAVPLAITVVPLRVLETTRGLGVDQALALVPGVVAQSRSGGLDVRVQIRGFGARGAGERSNAGTARGVRFYQDGIPETEPDGRTSFDLLNMVHVSRMEVVRSNASTLWGNASGGVVMLTSAPESNRSTVKADVSFGSFGYAQQALLANAPIGEGQVWLSLHNTAIDGWRQWSAGQVTQGTIGMDLRPDNKTRVGILATAAHNEFQIPGPLTAEQYNENPQQAQDDPNIYDPTYVERGERRDNSVGRIGVTLDHSFSTVHGLMATTFVQSKYLQRSERNTYRDFTRYHVGGNAVYRGVFVLGPESAVKILSGADLQFQDGSILFYNLNLETQGRGENLLTNKREGALNTGLFAQGEMMFSDVNLTAGIRYDAIKYISKNFMDPSVDAEQTYDQVTPKLGITYAASRWLNFYANLGGGIEVPAGNETSPPEVIGEDTATSLNPLLEPIRSTTYEFGIKGIGYVSNSLIQNVSYDAALFLIDIRNDIIPYRDGRFYMTAGRSQRIGAELGFSLALSGGLSLSGSGFIMSSTYKEYVVDSSFIDTAFAGRTADLSGNEVAGTPSATATLRLRYDVPFLPGVFLETDVQSLSSYYADDSNTLAVDGWTLIGASAGFRLPIANEKLTFTGMLRVANLADVMYMASGWVNPNVTAGGTPYIEPGTPRAFTGRMGIEFRP